jgi:TatD DNase family protein
MYAMIDSHCHLTDAKFEDDLDAVLQRAWDAGLTAIVTIASDAADADVALRLARRDPRIFSTAGVHPHAAGAAVQDGLQAISELLAEDDVVAVGETGLDYHYDNSPRDVQRTLFGWHLRQAADRDLPIVVHSRSADDDTAALIREASGVRGVLHCFSGGPGLLDTALDAGWFISFAGMVTFRNFSAADLLRSVPADRLLLETDSPYLAPVPHRGQRNEPAFVVQTCHAAAALLGVYAAELAARTAANARTFYRLPDAP